MVAADDNPQQERETLITPKKGLLRFDLPLLWRYKDLIKLFVRRDFVALYKQTILGPLWYIIQPTLQTVVFTFIFGKVANIASCGSPKPVFYMAGIITWSYFSACLVKTSDTFIANANIFGKVYFPRLVVPISVVISNLIAYAIQLVLFLCVLGYYGFFTDAVLTPNWAIALIPVLVLLMAGLGLGFGILISSLTTKYRDLKFLVGFGVQLAMYMSTVIFPYEVVTQQGWVKYIILANPMSPIIETFRYAFTGTCDINLWYLGYSAIVMVVVLFVGIMSFNRIERTFMDTV